LYIQYQNVKKTKLYLRFVRDLLKFKYEHEMLQLLLKGTKLVFILVQFYMSFHILKRF